MTLRAQYLQMMAEDIAELFKAGELRLTLGTEVIGTTTVDGRDAVTRGLVLQLLDKEGKVITEAKGPTL